jgi:cellulose 1,4-beta-cellobiosidase
MTATRAKRWKLPAMMVVGSCAGVALGSCTGATGAAGNPPVASPVGPATTAHAPDGVNPFDGARLYADPDFAQMVTGAHATATEKAALKKVAGFPTAVWLESTETAKQTSRWLDDAGRQQAAAGTPVVPVFVIYNLPNRDCAAEGSRGELAADASGEARYQKEFIDVIAAQFRAHASQRIVAIVEPDSLANLATNLDRPRCAASADIYQRGVAYAISKLSLPNVFVYVDAAHGGWLGWGQNRPKIAAILRKVLAAAGGPDRIRGFALNISNYNPARDPNGKREKPEDEPPPDEVTYASDLSQALAKVGITGKGFVIDTARNGRGGLRSDPGNWCNVKGAGLGERPAIAPAPLVDAYLWVKTPGESDGTSDPKQPRYDVNCSSDDAHPNAPQAGELFKPYLLDLVKNANPPL